VEGDPCDLDQGASAGKVGLQGIGGHEFELKTHARAGLGFFVFEGKRGVAAALATAR
jgi:hypothetical protein